ELPRGIGETVLVLDDEEALVQLNEELLAELGYEAVGFSRSDAALAQVYADPERFDLVLTDEAMPGLTGTDFALELRELRPDLPVILMSGYSNPALLQKARSAGIRAVLRKPLQAADIAAALASVLQSERRRASVA
ncbi:MAG TPA: response regulator, partial [Burkholderiales bacterium]|nr:response regulator [Burkholderiales bacterium]